MELFKDLGYVLICSANVEDVHMLRGLLLGNGYKVQTCSSFTTMMAQLQRQIPRLLIFDNSITISNIVDLCAMRDSDPYIATMQVVGIVPMMNFEYETSLYRCGINSVIYSPICSYHVIRKVDDCFERSVYLEEREGFEKLLFSLTSSYDARETNNAGHPERVASTARSLGRRLGMSVEDQTVLYKGGMLHDIGMIKVPRTILDKEGPLDAEEYALVKTHTIWGERLCSRVRSLERILPLVRHHHEQMDGSGYPDGLKGKQIPELARIIGICEVYDALISDRPYRPRMPQAKALECLSEYANRNVLDRFFVEEFVQMQHEENEVHTIS